MPSKMTAPKTASPVVRGLFQIAADRGLSREDMSHCAGVHTNTLTRWSQGHGSPNLFEFETAVHRLGYRLELVKE